MMNVVKCLDLYMERMCQHLSTPHYTNVHSSNFDLVFYMTVDCLLP